MPLPKEIKSKQSKRRARSKRRPLKRKSTRGIPVTEIAKTAGKLWKMMSERDRSPYINMARKAPIRRRRKRDGQQKHNC
ncbi:hypothetical protein D910_11053 [Dendroctonus ponderosae]